MSSLTKRLVPIIVLTLVFLAILTIMLFWSLGRCDLQRRKVEYSNELLGDALRLRNVIGDQTRMVLQINMGRLSKDEFDIATSEAESQLELLREIVQNEQIRTGDKQPEAIASIDTLERTYEELRLQLDKTLSLYEEGKLDEATIEYNQALWFYQLEIVPELNELIEKVLFDISQSQQDTENTFKSVKTIAWIMVGLAIMVIIILILIFTL